METVRMRLKLKIEINIFLKFNPNLKEQTVFPQKNNSN